MFSISKEKLVCCIDSVEIHVRGENVKRLVHYIVYTKILTVNKATAFQCFFLTIRGLKFTPARAVLNYT